MTSLLRFAYVMAVRRAVAGWRLEAVLFGGIVLAVALMASGDIFSNLVSNAALRHALVQAAPEDANFWVRSYSSKDDPPSLEGPPGGIPGQVGCRTAAGFGPDGALPERGESAPGNGHVLL